MGLVLREEYGQIVVQAIREVCSGYLLEWMKRTLANCIFICEALLNNYLVCAKSICLVWQASPMRVNTDIVFLASLELS
jgi:hypothetical protein